VAAYQSPRPPVTFEVTRSTERGQSVIRLASPSGRVLTLYEEDLKGTLYTAAMLSGRAGRLTLPRATAEALARLGTLLEPPAATPQD